MKTQVRVAKKVNTFKVGGKTLQDAKDQLGPLEWGRFQPIAGKLNPKIDKGKKVVSVEILGGHTIEMPVWTGYKNAPKPCQEEWDRMWKALDKHEQGHALVYMEGILKLELTLSGIAEGTITVAELATHLKDAMARMETAQDTYEAATDKGRKRGVVLNPPAGCV
jgi:predicted secreted Zn-dependent protease